MDDASQTMLLMKRSGDLSRALYTLEPISPAVGMELRDQFRGETRADRLNFYRSMVNKIWERKNPPAAILAGIVYESLVREILQQLNTIELHLVPMIKRGTYPRWHSNYGDGSDLSSAISINIHQTDVFSSKPNPIKDKIYYAPRDANEVALGSFIVDKDRLFIFQFTTAPVHHMSKETFAFFSQESLPPRANWYFILVVPPVLSELSCPQPRDPVLKAFLEEIHLCSVVVDPQP